jgi:hypothetical protein
VTTEVKKAIRTADAWSADQSAMEALYGAGGYYTTLSAWEAALPASLVTNDEQHTAVCYNDWPSGLSGAVTISGATTDATRHLKVTVADGHRHDGTPQTGFHTRVDPGSNTAYAFLVSVGYTRLVGLDVENTRTGVAAGAIYADVSSVIAESCIAKCVLGRGFAGNFGTSYATTRFTLIDCLAWGSNQGFARTDTVRSRYNAYNCVAANCAAGFSSGSTNKAALKNCVAYGSTTIGFEAQVDAANSDYNASSDTSANAFANYLTGITSADFVDAANNDFHLASASALIGAGTNLYSTFTTDIDGQDRPSTGAWDIGIDHYVASGGSTTYSYSGSGTLTLSGTATTATSKVYAYSGTGTFTYSGTATTAYVAPGGTTYPYSASGSLTLSGAATTAYARLYAYSASGSLAFSGTATAATSKAYAYSASGSLTLSGTATTAYTPPGSTTYPYAGTGTLSFSGAATTATSKVYGYTGAGTLAFSGNAATTWLKLFSYAGSGTLALSGNAITAYAPPGATSYPYTGTGTLTFSGSATVTRQRVYPYTGTGTIVFDGTAPIARTKVYAGSGSVTYSGAAVTDWVIPSSDSEKIDLILDLLQNRQELNPTTGTFTVYADDGVTVLKTALAWEDAAGTIPYSGKTLRRIDALT